MKKVYNQKLKWIDEEKEKGDLASIVYSGSPDYLPVVNNNHLDNLKVEPILKVATIIAYP
jgi:hypothetical protein